MSANMLRIYFNRESVNLRIALCRYILYGTSGYKTTALKSIPSNSVRNCNSCCDSKKQSSMTKISNLSLQSLFHTSSISSAETVEFKLSDIGEGIREVVIKEWFVKPGDRVSQFDAICEVQSDKAAVTITSRYDGTIRKLHYDVESIALVGNPLVAISLDDGVEGDSNPEDMSDQEVGTSSSSSDDSDDGSTGTSRVGHAKVLATPAVRRLAMENKVKLGNVRGTGKNGRILKEDILEFIKSKSASPPTISKKQESVATSLKQPQQQIVDTSKVPMATTVSQSDQTVKLRGVRLGMYKSMTVAATIPHFTYSDEVNLSELIKLRNEVKQEVVNTYNLSLSFMPFFLKAMSVALQEYPSLNAHLTEEATVVYRAAHNIGVAVDTPDGLVVPCVHNVQSLSIIELAKQLDILIATGRQGKLTADQLMGGTISLSNIGNIGGTYTKPVILPPQVCIGAVGRSKLLPRYDSTGNLVPSHILNVSWSADHRVVDGATMARFSNRWKQFLESPGQFLLQMK